MKGVDKLTNSTYLISVKLKGIKSHFIDEEFIGKEIDTVSKIHFDAAETYIGLDIEDILDLRTPARCQLMNIDILIRFNTENVERNDMLSFYLLEYLNDNFITPIEDYE